MNSHPVPSPQSGQHTNTSIKPYRVTYRVRYGATTIEWQWQPSENLATNWLWQSMANRSKPSNARGSCGGSAEVSMATFHKAQLTPRGQLLRPRTRSSLPVSLCNWIWFKAELLLDFLSKKNGRKTRLAWKTETTRTAHTHTQLTPEDWRAAGEGAWRVKVSQSEGKTFSQVWKID